MADRILYVNGGKMDNGGIASYMLNYYHHFNHRKLQVDFIVHGGHGGREKEVLDKGGMIYCVPTKRENLRQNREKIWGILNSGRYKLVHGHMEGMNGYLLQMADKAGIPVRISHSHNTEHLTENFFHRYVHKYFSRRILKYATHRWACSQAAGEWLYGKNREFTVIPNAINVQDYIFRETDREKIRRELRLDDRYVIGNIGRLDFQKNQKFLIDVISDVVRGNPKAVLLLVGGGPYEKELKQYVRERGLNRSVLFLGIRNDIGKILSGLDVFVLPSRYEGLPVSAIEAQANGVPCLLSDRITGEVDLVKKNILFLPLEKERWVKKLLGENSRIKAETDVIQAAGYDIETSAIKLQEQYLRLIAPCR